MIQNPHEWNPQEFVFLWYAKSFYYQLNLETTFLVLPVIFSTVYFTGNTTALWMSDSEITEPSKVKGSWAPVAHAYSPSYSGGRDQEDHRMKPVQANSSWDPFTKILITKIGLVEWLKVKTLSSSPVLGEKKKSQRQMINKRAVPG
jgi:hypothetical protein